MSADVDERLERVRTALAGLAPDQSERLVRMVELGAMICLVEASAVEAVFASAPSSRRAGERRRRSGRPHLRLMPNAGAT